MKRSLIFSLAILSLFLSDNCIAQTAAPLRVGIIGLTHDHVRSFLGGGGLVPAGGILSRPDVQLVGIVESDRKLFEAYAARYHLAASLYFPTVAAMVAATHPDAALIFTPPSEHRRIVEECARLGVSVMMEKPLAYTYSDALAMQRAAAAHHIHVLVDYQTTWERGNTEAMSLLNEGKLGDLVRVVARDGHEGPKAIGVGPEFLNWLRDPAKDGDGALTDFGCYGADMMEAMMHAEQPVSVYAAAHRLQPADYPQVDDDAEIIVSYKSAVAVIEASWDWPTGVKQLDVYGRKGSAKSLDPVNVTIALRGKDGTVSTKGRETVAPFDDPLHYLAAVLRGQIDEGTSPSSLKSNVIVAEILDAAWQSARTGKTVKLPLPQ